MIGSGATSRPYKVINRQCKLQLDTISFLRWWTIFLIMCKKDGNYVCPGHCVCDSQKTNYYRNVRLPDDACLLSSLKCLMNFESVKMCYSRMLGEMVRPLPPCQTVSKGSQLQQALASPVTSTLRKQEYWSSMYNSQMSIKWFFDNLSTANRFNI